MHRQSLPCKGHDMTPSPETLYRPSCDGCPLCGREKRKKAKVCMFCAYPRPLVLQPSDPTIRLIALTRGLVTKVSVWHYDWLVQWRWCAQWNPHTRSFYAYRGVAVPGEKKRILVAMSRLILGLEFGDKRIADHKNHDTLDNTDGPDGNLRIVSKTESLWNCRKPQTNTSGFKNVSEFWIKGKFLGYQAKIRANGKQMHLGIHPTKELAYEAYCKAAQRLHGEFACVGA
jgi:hypothetical protein